MTKMEWVCWISLLLLVGMELLSIAQAREVEEMNRFLQEQIAIRQIELDVCIGRMDVCGELIEEMWNLRFHE